jgi:hypothetical protein
MQKNMEKLSQQFEIRPFVQNNINGTLVADSKIKKIYFTPEIIPESKAHKWLLWAVIISGILVTPWWIVSKFINVPHIIINNSILWWIVLFLTFILPIILWRVGRSKISYNQELFEPISASDSDIKDDLETWDIERIWVWTVLFILPPTALMFVGFFAWKKDLLDALLITLHFSLFLRRLIPHAYKRITLSKKTILNWIHNNN